MRTLLLVQWLRIRGPLQRTQVRSLIWEDSTCWGAPELMCPQLLSLSSRARALWRGKPPQQEACAPRLESRPCSSQPEKAWVQRQRPRIAKINNKQGSYLEDCLGAPLKFVLRENALLASSSFQLCCSCMVGLQQVFIFWTFNFVLGYQWSCMDVRVGQWRKLSAEELMLLNCGVGEDF